MGNTFQPSISRFWWLVLGRPCRIDCAQLPPAIVHVTAAGPPGAQCHHLAFIRSRMRQLMNHTQMCNPCPCTSVTYVPGLTLRKLRAIRHFKAVPRRGVKRRTISRSLLSRHVLRKRRDGEAYIICRSSWGKSGQDPSLQGIAARPPTKEFQNTGMIPLWCPGTFRFRVQHPFSRDRVLATGAKPVMVGGVRDSCTAPQKRDTAPGHWNGSPL